MFAKPKVTGMTVIIRLQREAFDAANEIAALTRGRTDLGAVVTFTGICRADENGEPITALNLEHYPDMAEAEIGKIADKIWVEAKASDDAAAESWDNR